jgi:hypothetical protein
MDISLDTIIYIILGLIFVFAQVARNKRKKAQSQAAGNKEDTESEPKVGRSVLEQMLGIPEEKPVVEKPVENNKSLRFDHDPAFSQPGPNDSVIDTVNEEVVEGSKLVARRIYRGQSMKSVKRINFNLKQAVIYKAILERKKF